MILRPLHRCHHPTLDSIPIGPRSRVFVAHGDSGGIVNDLWPVAPHNHRYGLTITRLHGDVEHVLFTETPWGPPWSERMRVMSIRTPLGDGVSEPTVRTTREGWFVSRPHRMTGVSETLKASDFHTVFWRRCAVWRVDEHRLNAPHPTRALGRIFADPLDRVYHPDSRSYADYVTTGRSAPAIAQYDDLYQPMAYDEAQAVLDRTGLGLTVWRPE